VTDESPKIPQDPLKSLEAPSKPLALDDPLLLPEQEVHAEIGIGF